MIGEKRRIAGRCPNCGAEGLREAARFCDHCGTELSTSDPQGETEDEGSTAYLGDEEIPEGDATQVMPSRRESAEGNIRVKIIARNPTEPAAMEESHDLDEGATGFILDEAEGSTQSLSNPSPVVDEGATGFIEAENEGAPYSPSKPPSEVNQAEDEEEDHTRLLSEETDADEGATGLLPQERSREDEGATGIVATDFDEGATELISAEIKGDEGATGYIADETGPETDGMTNYLPETEVDDGLTISMAKLEETRPDTAVSTLSGQPVDPSLIDDADFAGDNVIQLHNRYHLSKILGRGGFGAVYLAEDVKLNRRCVVKQMLTRGKSPREIEISRTNFEREAKLLAELNDPGHPNIPEIYDYFSANTGNYLVMKYIEGQNLKSVLEQSGPVPWREAVRYAIEVSSALGYMHTHGHEPVLHRDVKPANIQLGDDGRVWLVDFGLAKADPVKGSDENIATQASGSFGYTPLEQWVGQAVPASDIYALGATLHHLVTGVNPLDAFGGEFHIKKVHDLHGTFAPIRQYDRKLPKELEDIISLSVAPEPIKRLTATQLQRQLEALISGGQETALYTFRNGQSAKTVGELVDLCEKNRQEAEEYLYGGDFERWFLLINRNDLVAATRQAIKEGVDRQDGLERFLKLILPNIFRRRLRRAGLHILRGTIQFALIAVFVIFLLAIGGSYVLSLFIEQSIGSTDWPFHTLSLTEENSFDEDFLTQRFNDAAGVYFDDINIAISPPDNFTITANWNDIPLELPLHLELETGKPHFYLNEINGVPLFLITDNISDGINRGVDEAFRKGPVDVTTMTVDEGRVVFAVKKSNRVPFATPTPAPTPTPTPAPTPTPVDAALVVVFNELDQDVILEISSITAGRTLEIAAQDAEVIEVPAGTYNYVVRYKETGEIATQGNRTWTLNQAYRLRIGVIQ